MTFKDVIEQVRLSLARPAPSAEEIQSHILHAYGFKVKPKWFLMSHDYVRMLVEGALWSMEHSWQRDKFERSIRLGP